MNEAAILLTRTILSETTHHRFPANVSTTEKPHRPRNAWELWLMVTESIFTICSSRKPQVRLILTDASRKQ